MKLGVVADIHGNDVALRAVLEDAARFGVERWWALARMLLGFFQAARQGDPTGPSSPGCLTGSRC